MPPPLASPARLALTGLASYGLLCRILLGLRARKSREEDPELLGGQSGQRYPLGPMAFELGIGQHSLSVAYFG
jgi:hypothetical protein